MKTLVQIFLCYTRNINNWKLYNLFGRLTGYLDLAFRFLLGSYRVYTTRGVASNNPKQALDCYSAPTAFEPMVLAQ